MSCDLVLGKTIDCKDSISGIKRVWIIPFINYTSSSIVRNGATLSSFPSDTIYQFSLRVPANVTETSSENENGKFMSQKVDLTFQKLSADLGNQYDFFMQKPVRIIVLDNNGNYQMFGVENGLDMKNGSIERGVNKSDFNGYKLSFEGRERLTAPFLADLSGFSIYSDEENTYIQNSYIDTYFI
jgi:hypothetical protein